jgi:exoribonuclease R
VRRAGGGAGYRALPGEGPPPYHAAVAAPYAHATAPLRRLADRYVLDLVVSLAAGARPGAEEVALLAGLPEVMNRTDALADRVEGAAIDLVEATLLAPHAGREFDAVVTGTTDRGARIQLREPAVRGTLPGLPPPAPGTSVRVVLQEADPAARRVVFRRAGAGAAGG